MRKVVETRQVAHLWANKSQDEARNSGGNFYFTGPAIYSYGTHYVIAAHLENGDIVFNEESRSMTTNKQRSIVRNALSYNQLQNAIYVPSFNDNDWRELDRLTRNPDGKKAPAVIARMAESIEETILAMVGHRFSGRMVSRWSDAKNLEKNALRILALCAKGKRTPAWPIAILPAELPQDKDQREAWIKTMVRGKLIKQYTESLSHANDKLGKLADELGSEAEVNISLRYRINNIPGCIDATRRNLTEAQKTYGAIHEGKKSRAVQALSKRLDSIEPALRKLVLDWQAAHANHEMRLQVRAAYLELRILKDPKYGVYRRNGARFIASKMASSYQTMCDAGMDTSWCLHAMRRIERAADWHSDVESLKAAKQAIEDAQTYMPQFPKDALNTLKTALRHALNANLSDGFLKRYGAERDMVIRHINELREPIEAEAKAKFASRVADWQAGTIQSLDFDAGTFARIEGNEMVTSRGARVPMAHACRLARIARRVIAHGGKTWGNDDGPQVGGFRVQSIRADGSATIGCHEFDSAESLRLLALLEACPQCVHVAETIEA